MILSALEPYAVLLQTHIGIYIYIYIYVCVCDSSYTRWMTLLGFQSPSAF